MPRNAEPMSEEEWSDEDDYDSDEDADYDPELEGVSLEDRAQWIERYHDELLHLWNKTQEEGVNIFGRAFLQNANFATFCYFCYKYTCDLHVP